MAHKDRLAKFFEKKDAKKKDTAPALKIEDDSEPVGEGEFGITNTIADAKKIKLQKGDIQEEKQEDRVEVKPVAASWSTAPAPAVEPATPEESPKPESKPAKFQAAGAGRRGKQQDFTLQSEAFPSLAEAAKLSK